MDTYYMYGHSERSEESALLINWQKLIVQFLLRQLADLDDLKKKLSYIIILLLLVGSGVQAQTITELEYFFNTDPGVGAATSITTFTSDSEITFTGDINASSLPKGIHTLFIRAKDSDDNWGLPVKKLVLVDEGSLIEIEALEYFFDTDPGVGAGSSISVSTGTEIDMTTDIDVSGVFLGIHTLFIRAKSTSGNWGLPVKKLVLVDEGSLIEIEALEYFFDEDPGVGKATQLSVTTGTEIEMTTDIDASGFLLGIHTLFIRAKSTSGNWGLPIKKLVLIDKDDPTTISQIVSAEYFFDTDPGFGNAQFLELEDASELEETVSLNIDSLSVGPHTLYIRVLDEDGEWSMIVNQEIIVTIPPKLESLELDTLFFTENDSATIITDSLQVVAEGGFLIDSAVVIATDGFLLGVEDQLNFTADMQGSVQFSFDSEGIFKFTGSASASLYQDIFRSIEFVNISDDPDTSIKIVSFQVFGNDDSSSVVSRRIQVVPVDDPPEQFAELGPVVLPEDVQDSLTIILNNYFRDIDSPISYAIDSDANELVLELKGDSLFVSSEENWYGETELYLEVSSLDVTLLDTLEITIESINDAPFVSNVLNEISLNEDFGDSLITHLDSLFSDVDLPNDSLKYSINNPENSTVLASIDDGVLSLSSIQNLNGNFSFSINATDDSLASDSLTITGIIEPVNDAPILVQALPDTSVDEDAAEFSLLTLSDYFRDLDSKLEFDVVNDPPNIQLLISDTNELVVSADPNWNGMQQVIIAATDGEFQINDTLVISVRSINDAAPTQPVLLAPNMHSESTINAYLVWSLAKDTVAFEDPRPLYQIQIDSSAEFTNPVINQSDIGLETILQTTSMKSMFPSVQQEPGDEDSVFAVRLGSLDGSDLLEDDVHYNWRVRSVDNEDSASTWSEAWNFWLNLENDVPFAITKGFTPADSITVSSVNPVLSWNAGSDPDFSDNQERLNYIVELSSETDFSSGLYSDSTAFGVNSIKVDSLSDESIYFWRVKVRDDEGVESDWSAVQAFIINQKLDPPNPFALLSPENGVDTLTTTPQFVWESTSDTDLFDRVYYRYRISEDSLFNSVIVETEFDSDTVFSTELNLEIGRYFWQVAAIDTDSLVTWASNSESEPFSFEIIQKVSNEFASSVPKELTLSQNYPNPFNPSSTIQFGLPEASSVRLEVFTLLGQKVNTLVAGDKMQAGFHSVQFDAGNLSSGIYIYRIQAGNFVQTKRMMLIK